MLDDACFMAFIPVRDLGVASAFYVDLLGLALRSATAEVVVVDAHGTDLRLTRVDELTPQPFAVGGWEVTNLESEVDSLVASGVIFHRYDEMDQDDRGIWRTPGGDLVAWFADPDGNTLSLTSFARP